jgi:hypothetical protein
VGWNRFGENHTKKKNKEKFSAGIPSYPKSIRQIIIIKSMAMKPKARERSETPGHF